MEVPENRRWMYNRINPLIKWVTPEFEQGVEEFLAYAFRAPYSQKSGQLRCPCVKCKCRPYLIMDEVKVHLYKWGFKPDYYIWTSHGETEIKYDPPISPSVQSNDVNDEEEITSGKNKKAPTNGLRSEAQDVGSPPYSHAPVNNSGLHRVEVPENRRWMYNRIDPRTKWVTADFEKGVEEFLAYALQSPFSQKSGQIRCPCVKCKCRPHLILDEVKVHIYKWGFMPDYYKWSKHGAGYKYDSPISLSVQSNDVNDKEEIAGGKNKKARINGLRSKAQGNGSTPCSHANFNNSGLHPDFEQELRSKIQENESLIKELRQENQDLRQVNLNILSRLMAIEHKLFGASNNSNAENDEAQ